MTTTERQGPTAETHRDRLSTQVALVDWDKLTDAQRRRSECLLVSNLVFPIAASDFRYRVARWLATGADA